ncbi:hypothetical protein ACFSYD_07895 [Paracoccus aerius]
MNINDDWKLSLHKEELRALKSGLITEQDFRAMMSGNTEAVARWDRICGEVSREMGKALTRDPMEGIKVLPDWPYIGTSPSGPSECFAGGTEDSLDPRPDADSPSEASEYPVLPYDDDDDGGCPLAIPLARIKNYLCPPSA